MIAHVIAREDAKERHDGRDQRKGAEGIRRELYLV